MMAHNASSCFVTGSKLRRVSKRYALGFQLLLIVWNPITRDVFRMNCIHLVLESHCIIITPLNTKRRSPVGDSARKCWTSNGTERSIRFGSIKVPLTVGSGKESSIYEVKICRSDLTVATAAARTVSMYGQVVRDCRSFGRPIEACGQGLCGDSIVYRCDINFAVTYRMKCKPVLLPHL